MAVTSYHASTLISSDPDMGVAKCQNPITSVYSQVLRKLYMSKKHIVDKLIETEKILFSFKARNLGQLKT